MSFKRFKKRLERLNTDENIVDEVEIIEDNEQFVFNETEIVNDDDLVVNETELESLTKDELDEYALNYDIELDRRKSKTNMIKDFLTEIKGE